VSYNTKTVITDALGVPVPQYFDPTLDAFRPLEGENSGIKTRALGGTSLKTGLVAVPVVGTRVQLPNVPCNMVLIIARDINVGFIYVGDNFVSSTSFGAKLKSEGNCVIPVNNANLIWIDATVNGEGVSYVAV
jgi:hypothetical protein